MKARFFFGLFQLFLYKRPQFVGGQPLEPQKLKFFQLACDKRFDFMTPFIVNARFAAQIVSPRKLWCPTSLRKKAKRQNNLFFKYNIKQKPPTEGKRFLGSLVMLDQASGIYFFRT